MRDIACSLLEEVCNDVAKESLLQPLQGEQYNDKTAKVKQEARVASMPEDSRTEDKNISLIYVYSTH